MREQKKNQLYTTETCGEKIVIVAAERDIVSETIEEALVPRTRSKIALVKST
jgi:hypothetical protein